MPTRSPASPGRGVVVLLAGTAASAVLALAYAAWAGRVLGPEEFSAFTVCLSLIYLGSVAAGPINSTLARFSARYVAAGEPGRVVALLGAMLRRIAGLGALGLLACLPLLRPAAAWLRLDSPLPLLLALAAIYLTLLAAAPRGALRGLERFGALNLNLVTEAALRLAAGIALLAAVASATVGLAAYAVALAGALLLARLQLAPLSRAHQPLPVDGAAVRRFGAGFVAFALANAGFQNVDMLLVKQLFVPLDAGLYGAAVTLARAFALLAGPFQVLALPLLARRGREEVGGGAFIWRLAAIYAGLAALPLAVLWLWPGPVLAAVYGAPFGAAAAVLPPLATAYACGGLAVVLAQLFVAGDDFAFLYPWLALLVLEVAALELWHPALETVARVVLITQLALLAVAAGRAWARPRRRRRF